MVKYKFSVSDRAQASLVFDATSYDMYNEMAIKDCNIWVRDTKNINVGRVDYCYEKYGKAIVVLGDSHAMNLFNILSLSNAYPFLIGVSQGGCRPHNNKADCHYDDFDQFAQERNRIIDFIIYHQSGSYFIANKYGISNQQAAFEGDFGWFDNNNIDNVIRYLKRLRQFSEKQVVWIGPFLEYRRDPINVMFTQDIYNVNPISIQLFEDLNKLLDFKLNKLEALSYVRFNRLFFEPKNTFVDNCFVFRDTDHYSKCGEILISKSFEKDVIEIIRTND